MTGAEVTVLWDQEPRNTGSFWKLEKSRKHILGSSNGMYPANKRFDFCSVGLILAFGPLELENNKCL